jgi:hypothetical protein
MAKRPTKRGGDYEVGWGRPPKSTRWPPGQSGNPKGRRKGSRDSLSIFEETLNQKIAIDERGKKRTITAKAAIIRRLVAQALKGDLKAIAFVLAKEPEISRHIEQKALSRVNTKDMSAEELSKLYLQTVRQVKG